MYQKQQPEYYVYILTNSSRTLYIGVTNDLVRRVYQHRQKLVEGFTKKYNVSWLVYYEQTLDVKAAILREKQIKAWRREKKVELIESFNPQWKDLSVDWYEHCNQTPEIPRGASERQLIGRFSAFSHPIPHIQP